MTKWLVTGGSGMLGQDVVAALREAGESPTGLSRGQLDITSWDAVRSSVNDLAGPGDVVVNCAAYTAVDDAETAEAAAFAVNAVGPQLLARACADVGARLVQVSTDYVFSGESEVPYEVSAPLAPRSAYGRTKAAGEWAVLSALPESWIVRTAWLYGEHGPSFVRTMRKLEASREFVDVVDDQHGQPTWTRDLAARIVEMVTASVPFGVYHATSSGRTTWHGLACAVFAGVGASPDRVRPTTSAAFVRPAPRPAFSVLDLTCWEQVGLKPMRSWDEALTEALPVIRTSP